MLYFYDDRQWYSPFAGGSHEFLNNGEQVLDDRILFHYLATGITPAMAQSAVGQGSAYAFTAHDKQGVYLDGSKTYKVTLPEPIPPRTSGRSLCIRPSIEVCWRPTKEVRA